MLEHVQMLLLEDNGLLLRYVKLADFANSVLCKVFSQL